MGYGGTDRGRASAVAALKELITIITGLAAANVLFVLMAPTLRSGRYSLNDIESQRFALALLLVLTLVRFYLGNIRHLDETYVGRLGKAQSSSLFLGPTFQIASDFFVVLVQAILLSIAGYLIASPKQFSYVFAAVLLLDAVWFYFVHHSEGQRQKAWVLNNIFFGVAFAVVGYLGEGSAAGINVWWLVAIGVTNLVIDFGTQIEFYFAGPSGQQAVFLAAPLTSHLTGQDESGKPIVPEGEFRDLLLGISSRLGSQGLVVHNAHVKEAWGKKLRFPRPALEEDSWDIDNSDIMVALIEDPPSPGVQIELGRALTHGIPIVQVRAQGTILPYLNQGMRELTNNNSPGEAFRDIEYDSPEDCITKIDNAVRELLTVRLHHR